MMRFITNGDFIFPFNFKPYLLEQIYIWSYNLGTPNADEMLRFFIRLPNLLIYWLTGSHLAVSYFYILLVGAVCFYSFKYFSNHFIGIHDRTTVLLLSLVYAFNPIFLGNYAKLGLILAATMALLLLTYLKQFFRTGRFMYLLLAVFALNVSFIHPFCLAVNFIIFSIYLTIMLVRHRPSLLAYIPKLLVAGAVFVLLNAYIFIAVLSLGTISKSAISQNLSDTSLSSANLVNIANTGDVLTAFSFSKNVFLDFQFYDGAYQYVYFTGMYVLLALLIGLFIFSYYKLTKRYKKYLLISVSLLLMLVLLSTGTFIGIDKVLNFLGSLPAGWSFRSPLKWQLYIPLFFCASLILLLDTLKGRRKQAALAVTAICLVAANGFVGYEVFRKLLVPDTSTFAIARQEGEALNKRALLVKDDRCRQTFLENFSLLTNIREAYASHNIQLKEIEAEDADTINLSNYHEIVSCAEPPELRNYSFVPKALPAGTNSTFRLYENSNPKPKVYATNFIATPSQTSNLASKQSALREVPAGSHTDFVDIGMPVQTDGYVGEFFESMSIHDIRQGALTSTIQLPEHNGTYDLKTAASAYYKIDDVSGELQLFDQPADSALPLPPELEMPSDLTIDALRLRYQDTDYPLNNLVRNGSLESGLWTEKVGDCFNFDANPQIDMRLDERHATDGNRSLALLAGRHLACTGPPEFRIIGDESYLIYFDYRTAGSTGSKYNLLMQGFEPHNSTESLPGTDGTWQTYSKIIEAPAGVSSMKLTLYGIPSVTEGMTTTHFDNIHIVKVPKVGGAFFAVQDKRPPRVPMPNIAYTTMSPTKLSVDVRQAGDTLNLALNDSHHQGWKLMRPSDTFLPFGMQTIAAEHVQINRQENAWQIDIKAYCERTSDCVQNDDGTYNLALAIEFTPQRWLTFGLMLSSLTMLGSIIFILVSFIRSKRNPMPKPRTVYELE